MLNPNCYENSRPDGIAVLEVVRDGDGEASRRFIPLRRTELRGDVAGPLAALRLTQVFGYSSAECDRVLEAVYRFPLPGDAAVTAVRVEFGDVAIRARLDERDRAEADYDSARREGRQAALARRESADVFTLQVAGLRPDQDVVVETTFVQLARPEGAGWSLRIPTTTAPRYVRGDEAGSRPAAGQPLGLLRDPGHRFALDLMFRDAGAVESPTHPLDVTRERGRRRVRLRDGEVVPDRDCVLTWRPSQEPQEGQDPTRPALQVLLHDDPAAGYVYFLALVAPPATRDSGAGLSREVVVLVDRSSSMFGPKWRAADWAVERFIADLTGRDALTLGLFHNSTRWFARAPRPADSRAVGEAIAFLKAHRDSGGTELGVALEQALDMKRSPGAATRHVLVVTDAEVTDAGRILRLAATEARRVDRRRISVLCIDAAPKSALAPELAERGGGVARFLTSDPDQEDIATALDEVLADWSEPVLAGLRLEVDRAAVVACGRAVTWSKSGSGFDSEQGGRSAIDLGDLPAGRSLWVIGRARRGEGEAPAFSFRLTTARGVELATCRHEGAGEVPEGNALKAIFGARQVLGLEHLIHAGSGGYALRKALRRLGYDPKQVLETHAGAAPKVYAENATRHATEALRDLLVREALDYGLASSETAFVAVRAEAGRVVEGTVAVANALPAGWSDTFIGGGAAMAAPPCSVAFGFAPMPADRSAAPPSIDTEQDDFDHFAIPAPGPAPDRRRPVSLSMCSFNAVPRARAAAPAAPRLSPTVVYNGTPALTDGEAVLFDSTQATDHGGLPDQVTLGRLSVRFPRGVPDRTSLDPGLVLRVYVDDLTSPRARVKLIDLIKQRGERPLNLRKGPGQVVRIILADPAGAWTRDAPPIELALAW